MGTFLPALTLFLGSFLLFGIQPMLGRTLLPPFGGSAAVWTVCLATYQILLLAGYGYAHFLAAQVPQTQRKLHLGLLSIAALWSLGFAAFRLTIKDRLGDFPVPAIEVLACVVLFVGFPYVLLSSGSSLVQVWLSRGLGAAQSANRSRNIYRLYALSNLGSLMGLLIYPFLLEPFVSLSAQWYGFAACFLVYVILLALLAKRTSNSEPEAAPSSPPIQGQAAVITLPRPLTHPCLWFWLPCLSSSLLNAVTVHLSTDVTPVPMMWVLLLTAFLLSYIVGFSSIGEKGLIVWAGLAAVSLVGAALVSGLKGGRAFLPNLLTGMALVLLCCTFLHSWLYRIRPDATHLTRFYLGIAAGGALGGATTSLLAPVLFNRVWEYPIAMILMCVACAWLIRVWNHPELKGLNYVLLTSCGLSAFIVISQLSQNEGQTIRNDRNFYGCLRTSQLTIKDHFDNSLSIHQFHHGETLHGIQVQSSSFRHTPTTYFGPLGGGFPLLQHPFYRDQAIPMNVAIVGLGIGTLACYGRTNDLYRFYEINPLVADVAMDNSLFTFLSDSAAKIEIRLGDARKSLESERVAKQPRYDVLIIDAYSGDSVPLHLATQEAFKLYLDRLAPNGTLAIHLSNWHIDLLPLCKQLANQFELHAVGICSSRTIATCDATWVLLTRHPSHFDLPNGAREIDWTRVDTIAVPTDEKGCLLSLIRFRHTPPVKEMDIDLYKTRLF